LRGWFGRKTNLRFFFPLPKHLPQNLVLAFFFCIIIIKISRGKRRRESWLWFQWMTIL
jgi:hypothetical protein